MYSKRHSGQFIVDGVDLYDKYGMVLTDEVSLGYPEPVTHLVEIPSRNGSLDLTNALNDETTYSDREQSFTFVVFDVKGIGTKMTEIRNFLNGKRYKYRMVEDEGYTYEGRFSVEEAENAGKTYGGSAWKIPVSITADPYKIRETKTYELDVAGGAHFTFRSGAMPVHPIVESDDSFYVEFNGEGYNIDAGTSTLRFVTFHEGDNDIYITSSTVFKGVHWEDVEKGGTIGVEDGKLTGMENNDGHVPTWGDIAMPWCDLMAFGYEVESEPQTVYITYEWGDL